MKLGYSTWGMPNVPIHAALDYLANLGFDGVELTVIRGFTTELDTLHSAERRRIRRLYDQYNLDLPAISAHQSLLVVDEGAHKENWRRLTGSVDLCIELAGAENPPVLNTTLGSNPDQWESQVGFAVERVGDLVDYCSTRQVILALEPHIGDSLSDPEKALWLLSEIDSPYLKLNFDISHFDVQGLPTKLTVPLLAPHSAHTHVKDQRGQIPDFEFLIPGEGCFDFVVYLEEMQRAGYDGYITAEVSMQVQKRPAYDPLSAAEQTFQTLEKAFREARIAR